LGQLSVRSLGWNLGTLREIGGGGWDSMKAAGNVARLHKPAFTYRMAYLAALPMMVGMLGATIQYLMTGKGPEELKDYFFPKTGEKDDTGHDKRITLPSYMKDLYAYGHAPWQTIAHKLHPDLAMLSDMLRNTDYYGTEIRNAKDPFIKQLQDVAAYAGKQAIPFGIRNAKQGDSVSDKVLPFIGLTPAPKWLGQSASDQMSQQESFHPDSVTPEQRAKQKLKSDLREAFKNGDKDAPGRAVREGKITAADATQIRKQAVQTQAAKDIRAPGITLEKAMDIWDVMTPAEQDDAREEMRNKISLAKSYNSQPLPYYLRQSLRNKINLGAEKK